MSFCRTCSKTEPFADEYISSICFLLDNGEDRLLTAVDRGVVPATIAMEIAKSPEADVQVALADAHGNTP